MIKKNKDKLETNANDICFDKNEKKEKYEKV